MAAEYDSIHVVMKIDLAQSHRVTKKSKLSLAVALAPMSTAEYVFLMPQGYKGLVENIMGLICIHRDCPHQTNTFELIGTSRIIGWAGNRGKSGCFCKDHCRFLYRVFRAGR